MNTGTDESGCCYEQRPSGSRSGPVERWNRLILWPPQVQALDKDIRAWVDTWNENPKLFVWTKTAAQILKAFGRLMKRINGAEH